MKRLILLCFLTASSSAWGEHITFGTGEWAPYTSENLNEGGPVTKIVRKTLSEMRRPLPINYYPWERSKKLLETVKIKGSFPWRVSE